MANSEAMTLIFLIKKRKEKKFYNGLEIIIELRIEIKIEIKSLVIL